jgi:DNA-binding GntR family transcriptional regulator
LIREALECLGARLYCGEKVIAHEAELMEMAKKLDVSSPQFEETIQLDIRFHTRLIELTGIQSFIRHYQKVIQVSFFHAHHRMLPHATTVIQNRHVDLIQQLKICDKAAAEDAIRQHVRQGKLLGFE